MSKVLSGNTDCFTPIGVYKHFTIVDTQCNILCVSRGRFPKSYVRGVKLRAHPIIWAQGLIAWFQIRVTLCKKDRCRVENSSIGCNRLYEIHPRITKCFSTPIGVKHSVEDTFNTVEGICYKGCFSKAAQPSNSKSSMADARLVYLGKFMVLL